MSLFRLPIRKVARSPKPSPTETSSNETQESQSAGIWDVVAAVWLVVVVLDLGMALTVPSSALRADHLPFLAKLGLVGANAASGFLVLVMVATPVVLLWRVRERCRLSWMRWGLGVLLATMCFAFCLLYMASWATFRDTGQFLDRYSIVMFRAHPLGMWQHAVAVRPWSTLLGPVVAMAAALMLTLWLPRIRRLAGLLKSHGFRQHRQVFASMALILLLVGEWLPGRSIEPCTDPKLGRILLLGQVYRAARDDETGPLAHIVADGRHWAMQSWNGRSLWSHGDWWKHLDDSMQEVRRPQMSLSEYCAQVDPVRFQRHNVIILLVESLRPDQLRSFGGDRNVMPHVDEIASESLIFTQAYSQASHSSYADLCPLSSHYPLRGPEIHIYPKQPPYPRVLFYDVLKQFGHHTSIFSSQNEYWGQMINYLETGNLDHFLHSDTYKGPTYVSDDDWGFSRWTKMGKRSGKIDDRFTVREAIRWIDERRGEPFCMYMNLQNSHTPYVVPSDFKRRFSSEKQDFVIAFSYPPDKAPIVKDVYSDSLAYVDEQIGKLVRHLKRIGQWDNTVLVLTADTGQAFFEHGFAAHANKLYNEVLRVPMIIRAPGLEPGEYDRLAEHVDVPPTLFHLLELPPHPAFQGRNLLAPAATDDESAYLVVQSPNAHQVAIVREGHKLIYDLREQQYLLYDLVNDPGELKDIAASQPELTRRLSRRLHTWCKAQLDYYGDAVRMRTEYPPVLQEKLPVDH